MGLHGKVFQEQGIHRGVEADLKFADLALGQGRDRDAREAQIPIAFFSGTAPATTDAGYNRVPASCKVHLVRPTCFMYVAKSQ
jgi:hypothetical protein